MQNLVTKQFDKQLEALNSEVRFEEVVSNPRDKEGEIVEDKQGRPKQMRTVRATLYSKADGRQWCLADGADEPGAMAAVMAKAATIDRPASTAGVIAQERDALAQKLAESQAEIERLRAANGSIHVHPGTSQRKRSEPAVPPPATPPAAPVPPAEPADNTSRNELKALLTSAGVQFDGRASLEKLQELASTSGLIPA